jgi:hypothetical protein
MDEYLPYFEDYGEGLAPVVEDFGGGFVLPEAAPPRITAEDRERELIALLSQMTPPPSSEQAQRQPRAKRIKTRSASLGTIDRDTGAFTPIESTGIYAPSINAWRSPEDQRLLTELFPDFAWGYNRLGEFTPFGNL